MKEKLLIRLEVSLEMFYYGDSRWEIRNWWPFGSLMHILRLFIKAYRLIYLRRPICLAAHNWMLLWKLLNNVWWKWCTRDNGVAAWNVRYWQFFWICHVHSNARTNSFGIWVDYLDMNGFARLYKCEYNVKFPRPMIRDSPLIGTLARMLMDCIISWLACVLRF